MLLNVDSNANIVIESDLCGNDRGFFCNYVRMYLLTIGRRLTQMIAYFLVTNSKRCNIDRDDQRIWV